MKFIYSFVLILISNLTSSQTTIYSENFGKPTGDISVTSFTGYQNSAPIIYSGSGTKISDKKTSNTTYYSQASDSGNAFFKPSNIFYISGINTSKYFNIYLSLGISKNYDNLNGSDFKISYSSDSINWTNINYTIPTGAGTANKWYYKTFADTLTATTTLFLRFNCTSSREYRIDDVKIVGSPKTPLPVKLIYFYGFNTNSGNQLLWSTATEINNDKFLVERSEDGIYWTTIYEVSGAGNSFNTLNYSFLDLNPKPISYYRLKQIDFNGEFEYSKIVAVISPQKSSSDEEPFLADLLGRDILATETDFYIIYIKGSRNKIKKVMVLK